MAPGSETLTSGLGGRAALLISLQSVSPESESLPTPPQLRSGKENAGICVMDSYRYFNIYGEIEIPELGDPWPVSISVNLKVPAGRTP